MSKIIVVLSSASMGDVGEADFDVWAEYVAEKIDEATGLVVEVEQARFGDGAGEDTISGASDAEEWAIRMWLSVTGWNTFCGKEWESRRKAHDAAT